jgi:hypothetical protein
VDVEYDDGGRPLSLSCFELLVLLMAPVLIILAALLSCLSAMIGINDLL